MSKPTDEEIINDFKKKATVPIHPHLSRLLMCGRAKAYEVARRGLEEDTGEFVREGKMIRVLTGPARKKYRLEV
jgi:hypothetical protein